MVIKNRLQVEEEQTTQWPKDRQHNGQKKDRQHNGQKKKYKRTNNDLQNIHIKLKIGQHEPHKNRGERLS